MVGSSKKVNTIGSQGKAIRDIEFDVAAQEKPIYINNQMVDFYTNSQGYNQCSATKVKKIKDRTITKIIIMTRLGIEVEIEIKFR